MNEPPGNRPTHDLSENRNGWVYGTIVHTRYFASVSDAEAAAHEMKAGLVALVRAELTGNLGGDPLKAFLDRFPT